MISLSDVAFFKLMNPTFAIRYVGLWFMNSENPHTWPIQ